MGDQQRLEMGVGKGYKEVKWEGCSNQRKIKCEEATGQILCKQQFN